jgi:hypothetical protein
MSLHRRGCRVYVHVVLSPNRELHGLDTLDERGELRELLLADADRAAVRDVRRKREEIHRTAVSFLGDGAHERLAAGEVDVDEQDLAEQRARVPAVLLALFDPEVRTARADERVEGAAEHCCELGQRERICGRGPGGDRAEERGRAQPDVAVAGRLPTDFVQGLLARGPLRLRKLAPPERGHLSLDRVDLREMGESLVEQVRHVVRQQVYEAHKAAAAPANERSACGWDCK